MEDSRPPSGSAAAEVAPAGALLTLRDGCLGSGYVRKPGSQGSHRKARKGKFQEVHAWYSKEDQHTQHVR